MLATSPKSRRRLASGTAAVAALAVAGLGLTASTTSAAAISRHVEQAVSPVAPPMPPAPPRPAIVAPSTTTSRSVTNVVVTRDGKATSYEGAEANKHIAFSVPRTAPGGSRMIVNMPDDPGARIEVQDIPAVSAASCGIGKGTPASMVIQTGKGEQRKIVVCTDRIRMITASAVATEANARTIEHNAYAQALAGLVDARAKMTANADVSDADRARALTAIDQSITEMKSQLARGR